MTTRPSPSGFTRAGVSERGQMAASQPEQVGGGGGVTPAAGDEAGSSARRGDAGEAGPAARSGGSRHAARKRTLEILYEADLKAQPLPTILAAHLGGEDPPGDFTVSLVRGVHRNQAAIDGVIERQAHDWKLSRMPVVDRNLLRIGLFELLYDDEVPVAVAIDEAVELAKQLSTEDAGRYVNGILARVAETGAGA